MVPIEIRAAAAIAIVFDMFFSPEGVLVCFVVSASQLDGSERFVQTREKKEQKRRNYVSEVISWRYAR